MTRLRGLATTLAVLGVSAAHANVTHAQTASPEPTRFEVSVGSVWIGRQGLGSNDANETTGAGGTRALFRTSTELASAPGLEARVGVRVWRALEADVEASYGKPQLKVSTSGDVENTPPVTATETIRQITVGASVVWNVPVRLWSRRLAPFATVGGGYLRQVHDPATLIDTGRYYLFGGGVKLLIASGSSRFARGLGVRVDAGAMVRSRGVAFDDAQHASPAIAAAVFLRF